MNSTDHSVTDSAIQSGHTATEMSLWDHLGELRSRIFFALLALTILSCLCYYWIEQLMVIFTAPFFSAFPPESLIDTSPAEAFMLKLKLAVFCGLIAAMPVILLEVWLFIKPGLYAKEQRLVVPFVGLATALFLVGVAFAYFLVLPLALSFFLAEYQSAAVKPAIKLGEHLALMIQLLICFGVIFEWPIVAYFLARLGVLKRESLVKWWRHAIVAIFVVAAVLTPPDVISQLLMAGPLLVLYVISIPIVSLTCRKYEAR